MRGMRRNRNWWMLGMSSAAVALLLACSHDITRTEMGTYDAQTAFKFNPSSLQRSADFVPGCNDCNPWIPLDQPTYPAAIGVGMNGPTTHQLNQTCSFQALVNSTGATPPYSYDWNALGQTGNGEFFYPNSTGATSSYTVTLTVTDAANNQGTVERTVYVGSQYRPCRE